MNTEELIAILSHDSPRKQFFKLEVVAVFLVALGCLTTKLWLGLRPELEAMTLTLSFCFKTTVLTALAILAVQALKASSVPVGRFKFKHFGIALAFLFFATIAYEWATTPFQEIKGLFLLPNFKSCLIYVTLYGAVISIVIMLIIKKMAPMHYNLAAGYIGLTSACLGAIGYSIHCPIDSPTFILVAYGLPQAFLYLTARSFLPAFLRW